MKYNFKPTSALELFGYKVYTILVENFSQTFFVGGMVRDLLLKRRVRDIDIATSADPEQVMAILNKHGIAYDPQYKKLGIVAIPFRKINLSVTTFRMDYYINSRYPKVTFATNIKKDALRRDFTVNSLYLSLKTNQILDFNKGLADIKSRRIKFIGDPKKRIQEDPLRIIRALRFALVLDLKLEKNTKIAIKNNFQMIGQLTKTKIKKEVEKIKSLKQKNILKKVINSPKLLDKYFK
ncbi:MAG TPA: hypothetical protein VE973_01680 [Candidatus Limnocylindria bacterium]|nr:hypothetical protein [Candidatus Limnocylindria bacterium]